MRKWFVLAALVVLAIAGSLPASAALNTWTQPITSDYYEGWEEFANYTVDDDGNLISLGDPADIMNDGSISAARISSDNPMLVYKPGTVEFGIGTVDAKSIDTQGMGLYPLTNADTSQMATITVSNVTKPWSSFGACWASFGNTEIKVIAYYASPTDFDTIVFTPGANDGSLIWHGWTSDKSITKLEYTGQMVAIDGLRADRKQTSAVPEPATLLGFGLPMLMVGLGKLKSLRK